MDEKVHEKAAVAFARCEAFQVEAAAAEQRGERLPAANKYLDAVFAARGTFRQDRLHCWEKYEHLMTNQLLLYKTLPEDQVEKVTILAQDEKEMAVFRVSAYNVLGMNCYAHCEFDMAAKCFRSALDTIEFARARREGGGPKPSPDSFSELDVMLYEYAADGVTEIPLLMSTYIDRLEKKVNNGLSLGQNATNIPFLGNDMMSRWGTDDALIDRMGAGGGKCDCRRGKM